MEAFAEATSARQQVAAAAPQDFESQRKWANAMMNQGLVAAAQGDYQQAETLQVAAQDVRLKWLERKPASRSLQRDVAQGTFNLGALALRRGHADLARQRIHEAADAFRKLCQQSPEDFLLWHRLIQTLVTASSLAIDDGQTQLASSQLEEIERLLQPLTLLAPEDRDYRFELAAAHAQCVELLLSLEELPVAQRLWQALDAELRRLSDQGEYHSRGLTELRFQAARQDVLLAIGTKDVPRGRLALAELKRMAAAMHADADIDREFERLEHLVHEVADSI